MTKLHKDFKRWLKSNGLQPTGNRKSRSWRQVFSICPPYFIGNDRVWRFTIDENTNTYWFQVSCPLEHFDRWANSAGETITMPETKEEFDKAIQSLLQSSKDLT